MTISRRANGNSRRSEAFALGVMLLAVLVYAWHYIDPRSDALPQNLDLGYLLAYIGPLRSELFSSGKLLTWYSVAYDGMPLVGHPQTHLFYPPLFLPILFLGTAIGVRVAYVFSLLLAASGMYYLARLFKLLYYLTEGGIVENGRRVFVHARPGAQPGENLHLITYDIPAAKYTDHGPVFFSDGQRPGLVNSIAVGKDGSVYALTDIPGNGRRHVDLIRIPSPQAE